MTISSILEEKTLNDAGSGIVPGRRDGSSSSDQNDSKSDASSEFSSNTRDIQPRVGKRRPSTMPIATTPKREIDGPRSSEESNESDNQDHEINIPSFHNSRAARRRKDHGSADGSAGDSPSSSHQSIPNHEIPNHEGSSNPGVSPDQERQILLLMLLAQVCALHDPTPRTFTVHVLELFERGILGRQSIHFLFELGLVPSATPKLLPPSTAAGSESHYADSKQDIFDLATVPPSGSSSPQALRSQEASAIRTRLQEHDLAQETANSDVPNLFQSSGDDGFNRAAIAAPPESSTKRESSWAVEHHPLSLSRYQREFHQVRLLNAGSFGEVFQATSKIDLRDYAVKRVAFSAWGYSKDSVTQVIREVHCLAQCNHPNVVRYFTSWLEPSWMTGSGATMISRSGNPGKQVRHQQKLLTDIQHMMIQGADTLEQSQLQSEQTVSWNESDNNVQGLFQNQRSSKNDRKFSMGSSVDSSFSSGGSSYDETNSDEEMDMYPNGLPAEENDPIRPRDDSILFESHSKEVWESSSSAPRRCKTQGASKKQSARLKYRYQICLFVQMQLCHPTTLGDWIRNRNLHSSNPYKERHERVEKAVKIFGQIVSGLSHIHKKNIVHRDLKPANLFRSLEEEGDFLIGDFGLSKLMYSATNHNQQQHKSAIYHPPTEYPDADSTWQDPLTAGVGTASYAANEQVTTRTYGKPADIFSLGLIMLELVCCFSTEHERMQTFFDCRNRRDVPSWISEEYPTIASTILSCTDSDPMERPTAEQLLGIDLLDVPSLSIESDSSIHFNNDVILGRSQMESEDLVQGMEGLQQEIELKNQQIKEYEEMLIERDKYIKELEQELQWLKADKDIAISTVSHIECVNARVTVDEMASSSSSEGGV